MGSDNTSHSPATATRQLPTAYCLPPTMNGVLVIDKPQDLTSHDVVAAARRLLSEDRIGHTGTLDPLATGVLPLALGQATRLARFLTAADKDYDVTIRFGLSTDSYDITGAETRRTDAVPSEQEITAALPQLRGDYLQQPPAYSAKKVQGRRAYQLARADKAVVLAPAPVRVSRAELLEFTGPLARVALTCSSGFYVRAFAHSLGELVGTGACLETLRRTRSGDFNLAVAVSMETLQDARRALANLFPLERLLSRFPAVTITGQGRAHVSHGRELGASDYEPMLDLSEVSNAPAWIRLLDSQGALVAIATAGSRPDSLHPSVVLI